MLELGGLGENVEEMLAGADHGESDASRARRVPIVKAFGAAWFYEMGKRTDAPVVPSASALKQDQSVKNSALSGRLQSFSANRANMPHGFSVSVPHRAAAVEPWVSSLDFPVVARTSRL